MGAINIGERVATKGTEGTSTVVRMFQHCVEFRRLGRLTQLSLSLFQQLRWLLREKYRRHVDAVESVFRV